MSAEHAGTRIGVLSIEAGGERIHESTVAELEECLKVAAITLFDLQTSDGFWSAPVESNACMEAEWLIACRILSHRLPYEERVIEGLLSRQQADGSWAVYPGAAGDINTTVEVYAALSCYGYAADHEVLSQARRWILENGGLEHIRVFTRYWLALIGTWPWSATPNLPPEIIRLPLWFPLNIYNFAQWARATLVPLTILSAERPVFYLAGSNPLVELFGEETPEAVIARAQCTKRPLSLEWVFNKLDTVLHSFQQHSLFPTRKESLKLCTEWIIRHQDEDGAWGGIQPPWIYGLLALHLRGYALTHPCLSKGLDALNSHWAFDKGKGTFIQATDSAVWDTMLSLLATAESNSIDLNYFATEKGLLWLLSKQSVDIGDWAKRAPGVRPGGWAFERANRYYPDVDDTAVALLSLGKSRSRFPQYEDRLEKAIERGVEWMLAMQCANGGWGAFDKDNTTTIISQIPFCRFGEALDPPSADVTGHVLEALGELGFSGSHPAVARAIRFLRKEQEVDGSWFGRWGVNYIYGTAAVLPGLAAVGEDMSSSYVHRAAGWLKHKQNEDGGWGESCASYMDPAQRGVGPSTPSQTAWAMMALLAVSAPNTAVEMHRGAEYLRKTQTVLGTWEEKTYTAAGFPGYGVGSKIHLSAPDIRSKLQQGPELSRGFMLSFTLYRHYFPMIALGRFIKHNHLSRREL